MSEAELYQIRMRLHQGELQKAARGELRMPLPAGPTQAARRIILDGGWATGTSTSLAAAAASEAAHPDVGDLLPTRTSGCFDSAGACPR